MDGRQHLDKNIIRKNMQQDAHTPLYRKRIHKKMLHEVSENYNLTLQSE